MSWKSRVAWARDARRTLKSESQGRFRINLFVAKAYEDENGDWYIEGVASGTRKDLQGDRMTPECIADMAIQVNSGQIPYCRTHWDSDWDGELGYIKSGSVDTMDQLRITVWLDREDPEAQKLWRKLNGDPSKGIAPRKLGMSIGGRLVKGHSETSDGEFCYVIEKLELVHVVPTSMPAYPDAMITGFAAKDQRFAQDWLGAIYKACPKQPAPSGTVGHAEGDTGGEMKGKKKQGDAAAEEAKRLAKAEGDPPPDDPEGDGEEEEEKEPEQKTDGGIWLRAGDITEDHELYCRMPQQQPAPEAGKSQEDDMGDFATKKDLEELTTLVKGLGEKVDTLAKSGTQDGAAGGEGKGEDEAAKGGDEGKDIAKGGDPRGHRPTDTDARDQGKQEQSWLDQLKASDEWKNASHARRMEMLNEASKK